MPDFPLASVKSVDEALLDDIPIVTSAALQSIPEHKQSIHPDIMYKLQLKSSILEIGVPVPKHMEEDSISFPCVVKADMGWCGRGFRSFEANGNLPPQQLISEISAVGTEELCSKNLFQESKKFPAFNSILVNLVKCSG